MTLAIYLLINRINYKEFAEMICYSSVHVANVANGKAKASPKFKLYTHKATDGQVDEWE